MNVNEICQIIKAAHEANVDRLICGELNVNFQTFKQLKALEKLNQVPASLSMPVSEKNTRATEDLLKKYIDLDSMTEEEVLYAATPYGTDLIAQREEFERKFAQEQSLKESK